MLWVTIFIASAFSFAILLFVLRPLLDRGPAPLFVEEDRLTDLLSRKDAALRAIKDLEFDRHVGKLEEVDFERFNHRLSQQALGLIEQIEQIVPSGNQQDDWIEQEVAQLRKISDKVVPRAEKTQSVLSSVPTSAKAVATAKQRFCTECGQPAEAKHKFCANCGTLLGK